MKYVFIVILLSSLFLNPCFLLDKSATDKLSHWSVAFFPLAIKSLTIFYGDISLGEELLDYGEPLN